MAYTSEIDKLERRHRENPEGRTFAPLADAYRKAGDISRALEILKAGLQLHPDYLSASIVLGRCHLDLGDLPSAEGAFRRVLDLDKENVIAIKALADIAERQARFDESEHWLNYLLSIDGSNEEARQQLQRLDVVREEHSKLAVPLEEPLVAAPPTEEVQADAETVEISPLSISEPESLIEEPSVEEPGPNIPSLIESDSVEEEAAAASAPSGFMVHDEPANPADSPAAVEDVSRSAPTTEFELEEDPIGATPSGEHHFDVGVERHEEIVLRPSSSSEYQVPSDADLLVRERTTEGPPADFEEDAPAPAVSETTTPEPIEALVTTEPALMGADEEGSNGGSSAEMAALEELEEEELEELEEELEELEEEELEEWEEEELRAEAEEEAIEEALTASHGEPLVTETIGDLYAAQGHHAQALEVYRQLLVRSPNDLRLQEKIEDLETRRLAAPAPANPRFAAAETGGQSVLSYFGDLLSARLPESNGSAEEPVPDASESEPRTGFLEEAFQTDEESVTGEPTRPASGPLSLSAIFGEDSSPVPPVVAGLEIEESKQPASHFDEFFGERPNPSPASTTRTRSVRLDADQDDLDQFHKWLKGLKR
jgi:tetratricopeptide (TPR) repeat protein